MAERYFFTFQPDWRWAPLAYWVHVPLGGAVWYGKTAPETDPPAPEPIPHRGFPVLHVEVASTVLAFSSTAQLDHFIAVMSTKPLPTSRQLAIKRDTQLLNKHWLSRLPAELKGPRHREKLVRILQAVRAQVATGDSPNKWSVKF